MTSHGCRLEALLYGRVPPGGATALRSHEGRRRRLLLLLQLLLLLPLLVAEHQLTPQSLQPATAAFGWGRWWRWVRHAAGMAGTLLLPLQQLPQPFRTVSFCQLAAGKA